MVRKEKQQGGKRPGRKPTGKALGLPHRARPFHDKKFPVHITWRTMSGIPSLRQPVIAQEIATTISGITASHRRRRTSFRILHYSIQPELVHLVVEAGSKSTLSRGLQGLGIWVARRVNLAIQHSGRVLADRYGEKVLTTPREVRDAIAAVYLDHKQHDPKGQLDGWSSARWFDGWATKIPSTDEPSPVAKPVTALALSAWRRSGLIRLDEKPAL